MQQVLTAITPIFILILLGFVLRRRHMLADTFWQPCEHLNYFYLFPVLMFSQVAKANLVGYPVGPIALSLLGAVTVAGLVLYGWYFWKNQEGGIFSSVIQGALRPNTYIGVAAAVAMYGNTGLTLTSISIAVAIPLLNIASIIILMHHGQNHTPSVPQLIKALVRNPVIMSVVVGGVFNLSGWHLPDTISNLFSIMGAASLPLGLLAVGAGLDINTAKLGKGPVVQSSITKLIVVPLLTLWFGHLLGLSGPVLSTIVLFNALPCTPSAYIMTKLLGGDHQLAAGIITIQTILAAVTMPLILMALHI